MTAVIINDTNINDDYKFVFPISSRELHPIYSRLYIYHIFNINDVSVIKSSSESAFANDPWTTYENLFRKKLVANAVLYKLSAGINNCCHSYKSSNIFLMNRNKILVLISFSLNHVDMYTDITSAYVLKRLERSTYSKTRQLSTCCRYGRGPSNTYLIILDTILDNSAFQYILMRAVYLNNCNSKLNM